MFEFRRTYTERTALCDGTEQVQHLKFFEFLNFICMQAEFGFSFQTKTHDRILYIQRFARRSFCFCLTEYF